MEGLKYILSEIEARRTLLHDFVKDIKTSKEPGVLSKGVPNFMKDGELIYRPNTKAEPHRKLTLKTFNSLYKKQFMELQEWSRLLIPLNPSKPQPANYEFNELLIYELGRGYCKASIYMWLINPYLRQNDRKFYLIVEHRRTPKPIIEYIKGSREWTYPGGFEIGDSELEKFLIAIHPYTRWKKDARKARPRANPAEIRAECGGEAYVHEENKIFTAPIIAIDEDTTEEQILEQLLFYAWGYGYFDNLGETEAYEELKRYLKPEVFNDIIMHLRKHTFSPYNAKSNKAYLKSLNKWFSKKLENEKSGGMEDTGGISQEDDLRVAYRHYPPGSVPHTAEEIGVHEWTIYRLIRQGEIKATRNEEGLIFLDNDAIRELKQLATQKGKHAQIRELARLKGKSDEAIKKWLQRHRDLPEDKFNKEFSLWLEVRQP